MNQLYWLGEYAKVLLGYGFVLYLWPLVVFGGHLKHKSRTYRFSFCTTVSVMIVNTGVLVLGFFHLLRPPLVAALYFGVFLLQLLRAHNPGMEWFNDVRSLLTGTMRLRRLLLRWFSALGQRLNLALVNWWESTRRRRLEYALLLVAVVFGMIYFSYGAFDEHSYGFGDQYVHHAWTYGLQQGQIFSDGIYPEAMHCVIYMVCTMFWVRLYSGVLFFAGIHVSALLVSAYLFMKELFHWRYTALVVLLMFLTFDQLCINEVYGMSRLSWTLPLEFGFFSQFLCALYLTRIFKRVLRGGGVLIRWSKPREWAKLFTDEDLFLFMMAIAASLAIHFYVTIIAIFFCGAVVLIYPRQLFHKGSFVPLMVAALLALVMAVAPMAMAFAAGYPLQGSIGWAMSVIDGTDPEIYGDQAPPAETLPPAPAETPEAPGEGPAGQAGIAPGESTGSGMPGTEGTAAPAAPAVQERVPLGERVKRLAVGLGGKLKRAGEMLYQGGYDTLYPGPRARIIVGATLFAFGTAGVGRLLLSLSYRRRTRGDKRTAGRRPEDTEAEGEPGEAATAEEGSASRKQGMEPDFFHGYLIVTLLSVILMVMYNPTGFGIPALVAGSRLCSTEQLILLMVYAVPVDYCFVLLGKVLPGLSLQILSYGLCVGIYVFTQMTGMFHGYLYYELTRYDAAVEMTNRIIDTLPDGTYTVISTTDELYQLIETGFHEELLTFVQRERDPLYTIPSRYVFLYIEKHPIHYAQNHFAGGPRWLAWEKYYDMYESLNSASQCPNIRSGEISTEMMDRGIKYGGKLSDAASDLEGRIILESKAYQWYLDFSELYPYDGRVVYEDEDFLCYCLTQNVNCLHTLGIYAENGEEPAT